MNVMPPVNSILAQLTHIIPVAHSANWGGSGRRIADPWVSSRTPEGRYGRCPICRESICIEPSQPFGDAPCPCCGHLICSIDPLWPVREGEHPEPLGNRRRKPVPTLAYRMGQVVAGGIGRVRRAVRAVGRRQRHPSPTKTSGGLWDYWLDG